MRVEDVLPGEVAVAEAARHSLSAARSPWHRPCWCWPSGSTRPRPWSAARSSSPFGIPFALVPLLIVAADREVMGELVNPPWLTVLAGVLAALIISLNLFLLFQVFSG